MAVLARQKAPESTCALGWSSIVYLKFLGSGDAFGSGGRFNTCFLIDRGQASFLVDCGPTSMIAIRKFNVDPNSIEAIILSHLHADHFGGLPYFILDGQLVSGRVRPLTIAGPQGLRDRLKALMEAHFRGSWSAERRFRLNLVEMHPDTTTPISPGVTATAFTVVHPSGSPSLALRISCDGKVISYTGDTEWVDALINAGR